MADPWSVFVEELRLHMSPATGRKWTSNQLAAELLVSGETVANWRKGRVRPSLELFPEIGRVLGMGADPLLDLPWDPTYLLRKMGLLGDSAPDVDGVIEHAFTALKLQSHVTQSQEAAGRVGMATGSALIAQRACELGTWAVGVWPAVEGPNGCKVHVADRLTFMRTDQENVASGEVWADFGDILSNTHALRSQQSVKPRWHSHESTAEAYWSIPRVGVTRSSDRKLVWGDLTCIAVVALTVQSWANDLASYLADLLGYGQTSTRELAIQITGQATGDEMRQWRRRAHRHLLEQRPARRTWSHFDHRGPLTEGFVPGAGLRVVVVEESDDVLRASSLVPGVISLDDLRRNRDEMLRIAAAQSDTRVVRMDPKPSDVREQRWDQVFRAAGIVVDWLAGQGVLNQEQLALEIGQRDAGGSESGARAKRLWDWLASQEQWN